MRSLIIIALSLASLPMALTQKVSKSARCGPSFGLTCKGSQYGNCCSQYSYCGPTDSYCGTGCQNGFGDCKVVAPAPSIKSKTHPSTSTSFSSAPSSTQKVSTNARCGKEGAGTTCLGSKWGSCCSQYSYCGSTTNYCGKGCQSGFGNCNAESPASKSSTPPSSPVSSSSTIASSMVSTWTTGPAGPTVSVVTSSSLVEPSSTLTAFSSVDAMSSSVASSPVASSPSSTAEYLSSSSSLESVSTSSPTSSALPSPTPSVCVPTNGLCTIDNFTNCCSQCCFFPTGDVQAGQCC